MPVVAVEGLRPLAAEMAGPLTVLMVKTARLDETSPGFRTPMKAAPAVSSRFAGTSADNCVLLRKEVDRDAGEVPAYH